MDSVKPGLYRHYKGNSYDVLGVARHSETLEELVVYRGRYAHPEFGPNPLWVRPLSLFVDDVAFEGKRVPRFSPVSGSGVSP
jgi:hypothetical protein